MIDITDALFAGASAGDESLTDGMIGRPAVPSERKIAGFRQRLKRFCEALPGDVSVEEILECIDRLESVEG